MTKLLAEPSIEYLINCKTGQVLITATIQQIEEIIIADDQTVSFNYSSSSITENAGNMIK